MEKRKNRSDKYQWVLLETVCSNEMMSSFPNDSSISTRLNPYQYSEDIFDLQDELKKEFWRIVESELTPRQEEVIRLSAHPDGYTQMEIAKMLGVNQSSITKSLNGNVDYKNKRRIAYGGSVTKLRRIIEKDEKIQNILSRIRDASIEKW